MISAGDLRGRMNYKAMQELFDYLIWIYNIIMFFL